jgi:hypothetical protein
MAVADQFRAALAEGDIKALRRLWAHAAPHLPPLKSDADAELALHHARTQAISIDFRLRAYSHAWLTERGLPSGLPDDLRPRAERMYPIVVEAVGVAVLASREEFRPAAREIAQAMFETVAEAQADGVSDPSILRARMGEARRRARARLFGSTSVQGAA